VKEPSIIEYCTWLTKREEHRIDEYAFDFKAPTTEELEAMGKKIHLTIKLHGSLIYCNDFYEHHVFWTKKQTDINYLDIFSEKC
jgi:hypothetical protein